MSIFIYIFFFMQAQFYTCLELGVCAHDLLLMPWCFGIVIATLQGPQVLEANFCRLTLKPFRTAFKPFGCTSWLLALSGLWLLSEDVVWKVLPCLESLFVKETDKKKLFTMLPWNGCTVQAKASMIMVSLVGTATNQLAHFVSHVFFFSSVLQTFVAW